MQVEAVNNPSPETERPRMQDLESIRSQLFHTYSTESTSDLSGEAHLLHALRGELTLIPHETVQLGLPFDWSADPIHDANWRFQFHTLIWLDRIRVEATKQSSKEGLDLYESSLKSWIKNNPESNPPSDYSWFDMAVGMRAIVLLHALEHFGRASWLVDAITAHGTHLANPENYEGRGNHSLHQDMGLLAVAQFLERSDWINLAVERIMQMFTSAVDLEGVCREGSIDYQYRNYRWYEEAARRIRSAGVQIPGELERRLTQMPRFMAHATTPAAKYALLGDTLDHRAPIISNTPTEWVKNRDKAPHEKAAIFEAGYLFARNDWKLWSDDQKTTFLTMRFGPGRATAVHGHEDAGSITVDSLGESLICDSGLYAYEAGDYRLYFRGRAAHNVIDVENRKYYPSADNPLLWSQVSDSHIAATVEVKGLQGVQWHRTLFASLESGFIIIDDRVRLDEEDTILQRWNLPVDSQIQVLPASGRIDVITPKQNRVQFVPLGHQVDIRISHGDEDPISGWRSETYRTKYPTPMLSLVQRGATARFSTLINLSSIDDDVQVADVVRTSKALQASITKTGRSFRISLQSDSVTILPLQ